MWEVKNKVSKLRQTAEEETALLLKPELSPVNLQCLVFSASKMAHVGLLYPSHESGGGKHNPKPSSFSRAEFLRQQRNPAGFPSRKRERRGTMQAVTRGARGTAGAPRTRDFCREDGNFTGKMGFLPAQARERGRFTSAGPREGDGTGTGGSVLL